MKYIIRDLMRLQNYTILIYKLKGMYLGNKSVNIYI